MAFDYILLSRARNEIFEAINWYERRRPGLGEEFLIAVENELKRIIEDPLQFPKSHNFKIGFRRAVLKRFPFIIIFSLSTDQVIVHSVFNTYRNPKLKP